MLQGDTVILAASVVNAGNIDASNVPAKITVLNSTQQIVTSFNSTLNLARAAPATFAQSWVVPAMQVPGDYLVKVDVTFAGTAIKLAETTLRVKQKITFNVAATATLTAQSRVLVLVSCRAAGQGASNSQDEPFCLSARKAFIDQYLTSLGIAHKVTTSSDEFRDLLRCGDYNTYWISGGANKLKDQLTEEVREAVLRGDALIVDGVHDSRSDVFDDATGITITGKQANNLATGVTFNGAFGVGSVPANGEYLKLKLDAGTATQATFANGDAAAVSTAYGNGKATLFAFDLMDTLQTNAANATLKAILGNAVAFVRPALASVFARSGVAPLVVTLKNNGPATEAELELAIPAGMTAINASPAASTVTSSKLTWRVSLAAAETRTIAVDLRMPSVGGVSDAVVKLFRVDPPPATPTLVEAFSQSVAFTTVGGEQLKAPLVSELIALTLTGGDKNARDKAVQSINSGYILAGQNKASEAIADYLSAATELDKIAVPDTTPYQIRIAKLMQDAGKLACNAVAAACPATNWGPVSYGVLVFGAGNMTNAESQAAVAVGGALTLSAYTVASKLAGDSALLAVGGNLSFNTGGVGVNGSGIIRVGGTANVNRNVTHRDVQTGVATENFTALKTWYSQLTDKVALLTGTAAVADGQGKLTMSGSDPVINVFTMTGASLTQSRSLVFNVPDTATVVVNVSGTQASFTNGQSFWGAEAMVDHARAGQIIYNFPQATSVSTNGFSPQGTLLAPRATLSHQNATLNGQAIVNSVSGSGAYHCGGSFEGNLPASTRPVQ